MSVTTSREMFVDRDRALALELSSVSVEVERGQLRAFARAIGETDPIYTQLPEAVAAGYRDLPVPPTYFFGLELLASNPFGYLDELGVDLAHILHGEQRFEYKAMVCAGDSLVVAPRIVDVYEKAGGSLGLIVKSTEIRRAGALVATTIATLVVRTGR